MRSKRGGRRSVRSRFGPFAFAAALVALACSEPRPPALSGVLITLDTTRADAPSCCGGPEGLTPALDRLAREGIVYEAARTVAPITLPAHASMLTGLYPVRHAVRDNSLNPLPDAVETLSERARAAGMRTAAFVAAGVLDPAFGLDQGFEVYEAPPRSAKARALTTHYPERSGHEVVRSALRWLRGLGDGERFFLWLHFFEPHAPYEPPPKALERAGGNAYWGEVADMDDAIARFLRELRERRLLDRTLVAVVGDHGEGLGDHGEDTHGVFCYDTTLRVPFLVRYPDGYRAGERSREIVSVTDVHPTFLEALELGEPEDVDGVSLYRRRVPAERGAYFESFYGTIHYGWAPLAGWVDAQGKYVHGPSPEYFRVDTDPEETRNLVAEAEQENLLAYREAVAEVFEAQRFEAQGEIEPELVRQLQALGYATAGKGADSFPHPLEAEGLPDPRDRRDELDRVYRALELAELRRLDEATALLAEVVEENPRNASARQYLADYLVAAGRCPEAVPHLEHLIEGEAARASTHLNLGFCLGNAGRNEEAVTHFKRAYELDSGSAMALSNLVVVLKRLGRTEEAEAYRRRYEELRGR